MKKKLAIYIAFITVVGGGFVIAQNEFIGNETNAEKQVQVGMTIPDQTKLSYINIGFCNDGLENITKNGLLTIRPGQTKEICMVFSNISKNESADIIATFVDTELSNEGNMVCSLGINTGSSSIASHIVFDKESYRFSLAPEQTLIKKARLHIPQDMTGGVYNGCIGYQLNVQKKDNDKGVFFVVRRRVGLMEIVVDGEKYNLGRLDDIKYTYQNHKIIILKGIAGIIGILLLRYIIKIVRGDKSKHNKIKEKK